MIVIGGGVSGLFTALDLSLRGFSVALLERGAVGSGTSEKMHGLLHSGARYAVTDPKAAAECASENEIITRIAPHAVNDTGGLFVAVDKSDLEFAEQFLKGLDAAGIKHEEEDPREAAREEPFLTPEAKLVIKVPDKVVRARELMGSAALAAHDAGALILQDAEVVGIEVRGDEAGAVVVRDGLSGGSKRLEAGVVINAAGPWAPRVAAMAGIQVDVMATMGVMVVYDKLLSNSVLNRMRVPSDGDIILPYGGRSVAGTTALIVEDPDSVEISGEDVGLITREAAALVPAIAKARPIRAYASVRPLIRMEGVDGRAATRDFAIVRHARPRNLITIIGGKFTTGRLVGERAGDEAAAILGSGKPSRTAEHPLPGDPYGRAGDLEPHLRSAVTSLRGSMDEEHGRAAAYTALLGAISRDSRRRLGWSQ